MHTLTRSVHLPTLSLKKYKLSSGKEKAGIDNCSNIYCSDIRWEGVEVCYRHTAPYYECAEWVIRMCV